MCFVIRRRIIFVIVLSLRLLSDVLRRPNADTDKGYEPVGDVEVESTTENADAIPSVPLVR